MDRKTIGVTVLAPDARTTLDRIRQAEEMGIPAAWMTSGGTSGDALTLFAAAASQTERIMLGTSILQTWSRHPVTTARQVQTIANLAPGRIRLGVGPSHRQPMESTFGVDFRAPLGHLRECLKVLKDLLQKGAVEFEGRYYTARATLPSPIDAPVMASALRPRSFEVCGAEADGAISWVCPYQYLRDTALPALRSGAQDAGRPVPPLLVHAPVCVHDNPDEARDAVRRQLSHFPRIPSYSRMFAEAGFPDAAESGWTNDMVDAVVLHGDEATVSQRLDEIFGWGASEVLVTIVTAGDDPDVSSLRTMRLLAQAANA